jgi:hypothetical protein
MLLSSNTSSFPDAHDDPEDSMSESGSITSIPSPEGTGPPVRPKRASVLFVDLNNTGMLYLCLQLTFETCYEDVAIAMFSLQ